MNKLFVLFGLVSTYVYASEFPTFKERNSGVLIELVVSQSGRFQRADTLKTLGQECIDAAGVMVAKESNLIIIPPYDSGSEISVVFRDVDRFGNKVVSHGVTCNFDRNLKNIINIEKFK